MSHQRYGRSFVQELLDDGNEEEALAVALRELEGKPDLASAHFDHGRALEALQRYDDAIAAMERALACNTKEQSVERFVLDDGYFSLLLDAAEAKGGAQALELIRRYRSHAADGEHLEELREWEARFSGRAPSLLDKIGG